MNTLFLIAACACWVSARGQFGLKFSSARAVARQGCAAALKAKVNQHLATMGFAL